MSSVCSGKAEYNRAAEHTAVDEQDWASPGEHIPTPHKYTEGILRQPPDPSPLMRRWHPMPFSFSLDQHAEVITCSLPRPRAESVTTVEPTVNFCRLLLLPFMLVLIFFSAQLAAQSSPVFPELSGRVVDTARLLNSEESTTLSNTLAQHETETSNQIVVVTLNDLQGFDIADYTNRLGRHWGIGQADRDNGVLLLVAPNERKVRIEVGYGLEGALTDVISADIIRRQILPAFREDDYPAGIRKGIDAIFAAVAGEYEPQPARSSSKQDSTMALPFIGFIAVMHLLSMFKFQHLGKQLIHSAFPAGLIGIFTAVVSGKLWLGALITLGVFLLFLFVIKPGTRSGGGHRGRSTDHRRHDTGHQRSGGGFSGGGGGFGGGGASGSW